MRKLSVALALLFLVGSASAFPSSLEKVDSVASPDDPAMIEVTVQNNHSSPQTFKLGTFSPQPSWVYVEQSKTIQPGENDTLQVTVTPGEYAIDKTYSMTVFVKVPAVGYSHPIQTSFNVVRDKKMILDGFNLENKSYDPGDQVRGNLKVRSVSSSLIRDYKATFSYENSTITQDSSPILPGGTRTLEFSVPVEKNASPGEREIRASLFLSDEEVGSLTENFSVNRIRDLRFSRESTNNLLSMTRRSKVTNAGNSPVNYTVNRTVPSYLTPITGFSELPDDRESKGNSERYSWDVMIQPGESFDLERRTNYWMPAAALLGIILAILGIKRLRNSVKFSKEAEMMGEDLRISINIENISDRTYRDVSVEDFVPDIAEVERKFDMAAPTVRKTNEGTKLSWNIDELEPGDQRVLQYTVKPKVEVEGGVELQEAVLKERDEVIKKSSRVSSEFDPE